jgi:hypothetical protein
MKCRFHSVGCGIHPKLHVGKKQNKHIRKKTLCSSRVSYKKLRNYLNELFLYQCDVEWGCREMYPAELKALQIISIAVVKPLTKLLYVPKSIFRNIDRK